MPRHELRSEIGMVLQDTWLFGGTIRDNLRYGNPDATDEQIHEAARVTYVDRFVHSLPDGYDTVINDEGDNICTGEKQLMTIARAFLSDPAILILDEATSSVDTRTEVLIQKAMNALRADRTSFVIAHRLSTIRGADVILVMEDGRIVEQGSHDVAARRRRRLLPSVQRPVRRQRHLTARPQSGTRPRLPVLCGMRLSPCNSLRSEHGPSHRANPGRDSGACEHGELVLDRRGDCAEVGHHVTVRRDAEVQLVVV